MPDAIRARIAALRSELDTLDDSLPPGVEMSEMQIGALEKRLDAIDASLRELAREVGALTTAIAVDRTRAESTAETARLALQSAQTLSDVVRASQARADEAHRAATEAAARQADLERRLREVEAHERDRQTQRRTLAAVTSLGGTAGIGSLLWHAAVSLGWVAG